MKDLRKRISRLEQGEPQTVFFIKREDAPFDENQVKATEAAGKSVTVIRINRTDGVL